MNKNYPLIGKIKGVYTGIGSRAAPPEQVKRAEEIGRILADDFFTLRSGHADGMDMAFEKGAISVDGGMEIFLPWRGFNGAPKTDSRYIHKFNLGAEGLAASIHPAWSRCTQGARKLHSRNCCQVLGEDLDDPTSFVLCWTSDGKVAGGTRTAIILAGMNDVPVYNLAEKEYDDLSAQEVVDRAYDRLGGRP